jgi:multisubunit Na+/H+ antiporter MnhB subunit
MDTAGSLFTGLTLASIITTGGLTLNLTENFGKLANNGSVKQEIDGDRLVGTYGNAVTGMSAVVVGLSALYLIFFIYGWYQKRGDREARMQRVYWVVMLLAVVLGVASAGVNLNLTENFLVIDDVETDPNPVVPGENYKLRGSYGTATLSMSAVSLGVAGLAFIWMGGLYLNHWNDLGKYSLSASKSGKRRELDFSTL